MSEQKLRAEIVALKQKYAALRAERDSWKDAANVSASATQVLQAELRHQGRAPKNLTILPDRR